jgi:SpoVK/Ycf46/Vps4 family AAA+-type ATPase
MTENMVSGKKEIQIDSRRDYAIPTDSEKGFPLLQVKEEFFSFNDLVVNDEIKERLEYIIAENQNLKRLRAYGLKPKQKILFCGPPGTGKTLSAKILSSVIGYPFVYIMFDTIISSFLGQTATNLRKIFDFIETDKFVVLFDEFDIVGKKRDDPQEHGEVKRIVNNFMQMIDNYDGNSILIAATNHPHLLDTAIWRRFDDIIEFGLPNKQQRKELFVKYLGVLRKTEGLDLDELSMKTAKYSAADIATICEDSLRKNIINENSKIQNSDVLWSIKEQKRRKRIMLRKS